MPEHENIWMYIFTDRERERERNMLKLHFEFWPRASLSMRLHNAIESDPRFGESLRLPSRHFSLENVSSRWRSLASRRVLLQIWIWTQLWRQKPIASQPTVLPVLRVLPFQEYVGGADWYWSQPEKFRLPFWCLWSLAVFIPEVDGTVQGHGSISCVWFLLLLTLGQIGAALENYWETL